MDYKKVTIAGSGVLGSQIAFQTAYHGFEVSVYDVSDDTIAAAKGRMESLKNTYADYFKDADRAQQTFDGLQFFSDLAEAVKDADLVIEAVPERMDIKQGFYEGLAKVAPEKTVFASNSSTLLPSQFAEFTGRPEKFLALHFANQIWARNTAEIMGHPGTDVKYVDEVTDFARAIGMIPFVLKKEQPGYILNSLLVPFLEAGMGLWEKDIADPATIDKNWMIATGAPSGPFAISDKIGMKTLYDLIEMEADTNPTSKAAAEKIKKEMLDQGKMGKSSGEGFYKYPNPPYEDPEFLKKN